MSARKRVKEIFTLKRPVFGWPSGIRFKVTARYWVQVSSTKELECVRLHAFTKGSGSSFYFSLSEFNRLFVNEGTR